MNLNKFFIFFILIHSIFELGAEVKNSVVLISCTAQSYLFDEPWKKSSLNAGTGTGFVIQGERILTNAHVVSNAVYIEVKRIDDDKKYIAKVQYIAHDCDLAILKILNEPDFFESMDSLELGGLPEVNSVVTTYGFPLGGSQLSVTRGVVSRIQQWTYSHSGSDAHLVIQTDAAINPGNSGGPVLQDGKVVGVAFQGLTQADNIGYLIPSLVVQHFLKDIEDGYVHGFGELGISYRHDLQNPMVRRLLKIPDDESGVLITRVFPSMPANGVLKKMDVLLEIEEYDIQDDGFIIYDGRDMEFPEVMERMQVGDEISMIVWRDQKRKELKLRLKRWDLVISHSKPYDVMPPYYIYGGMCFTPLSRGYLMTRGGWKKAPLAVRNLYIEVFGNNHTEDRSCYPVFSAHLPNQVNQGVSEYIGNVVEKINGVEIKSLEALKNEMELLDREYIEIKFLGNKIPLVLSSKNMHSAHHAILKQYHIEKGERF